MIDIEQALTLVLERARPRAAESWTLCQAPGRVLAEDIVSDVDSPPYDKSLVDGYAVRAADTTQAEVILRVVEEVTAGQIPTMAVETGTATRVMTGATLPAGADAVAMIERSSLVTGPELGPWVRLADRAEAVLRICSSSSAAR